MMNCSFEKKCGACSLLALSYEEQLKLKQKRLRQLFGPKMVVEPVEGMSDPLHYRHKVHAVFGMDRNKPVYGLYEEKSHRIIPVRNCLIEDDRASLIIGEVYSLLPSFRIKTYDERTGYGLLRHVVVRKSHSLGTYMVILVVTNPVFPGKNNFVKALRAKYPEISTIVLNINDRNTTFVFGDRNIPLYGPGYLNDRILGKTFNLSPTAFYQVNPVQTELLYQKAISLAGLTGKETVVDAYCGTGTIGICAHEHAGSVTGVELSSEAVRDGRQNIRLNQAKNVKIYQGDAGEFLRSLAEQGQTVDVVFMDPPRTGASREFLDSLKLIRPERIVYISCDPSTQKRDLEILASQYNISHIYPFDLFPMTDHVESVVVLTRAGL